MATRRNDFQESTRDRLRKLELFSELEDEALDRLAGLSRILHLPKKEMIYHAGETYRGMFVVLSGLAVVFKRSDEGRMLILQVCRPGDSFAAVPLFEEGEAGYTANARVTRNSEILFLPREKFVPFLKQHPEIAWEMLRGFAARIKEIGLQLEGVTLREVTERLAQYLVREVEAAGEHDEDGPPVLQLPLAKGTLASYLGMVHETLSRTFSRLVKDGIVSVKGSKVTIHDIERLKKLY
jgi:CRP/FNR family transcriptional regulator